MELDFLPIVSGKQFFCSFRYCFEKGIAPSSDIDRFFLVIRVFYLARVLEVADGLLTRFLFRFYFCDIAGSR